MEFYNPQYLSDAFQIIDEHGSKLKICSGMTHLLRFYPNFPEGVREGLHDVLHVGDVIGLSDYREENGKYMIGSTVRIADMATDTYLARYAPSIIDAAYSTSTPQIRNRRTIGGEIAWGSYHSPLVATLLALEAKVRVRKMADDQKQAREETYALSEFYDGERERQTESGLIVHRKARINSHDLILKVILPKDSLHRTGTFSFFRALMPKISTENSGIVVAVRGIAQNGMIHSAQLVASGVWMNSMIEPLPLEGVKMNDAHVYEKLYSYCERYPFDKFRRSGPSGSQLGLIVFGLLKEGFAGLLGR